MTFTPSSIHRDAIIDGKYRVARMLGRGGMGVVVEAVHLRLGTSVAIKVLANGRTGNEPAPENRAALVREAQVAARLRSEHVARVFDVGMLDDGTPFVVMEHLTGCTLHEMIHTDGPVPIARAVELILQACDAVAEAHALGIVHRDLKPANLFLTRLPNGRDAVKVLDFGIAKLVTEARIPAPKPSDDKLDGFCTGEIALGTALAGTPQYMAPEHFDRVPAITVEGDIWALGVILYEMLVGRRPYEAKQLLELIWKVTSTPPAPLRSLRPEIPPELEAIVMRCLARDPAQRYRRVVDVVTDLVAFGGAALPERVRTASVATFPPTTAIAPTPNDTGASVAPVAARRGGSWLAPTLAGLAVVLIAVGANAVQTSVRTVSTPNRASTAPTTAPPSPPSAKAQPVVVIAGSSTVSELGAQWSSAFSADRQDVVLKVQSTSSAAGIGALVRGEADLASSSRPVTEEELALARSRGVVLEPHVVARDGLAVVVHPDNRVDQLSMDQLRGLLTGRIRSWSGVGGARGTVHLLGRPEDQGSSEILRSVILKPGDKLADSVEIVRRSEDTIARVLGDPNAIGFVTFRDVGSAKTLKLRSGARGLPIAPSTVTIRSEHYPLRRDLFLYSRHDTRKEALDVLAFIRGPGRRVVAESGFVPPPDAP